MLSQSASTLSSQCFEIRNRCALARAMQVVDRDPCAEWLTRAPKRLTSDSQARRLKKFTPSVNRPLFNPLGELACCESALGTNTPWGFLCLKISILSNQACSPAPLLHTLNARSFRSVKAMQERPTEFSREALGHVLTFLPHSDASTGSHASCHGMRGK